MKCIQDAVIRNLEIVGEASHSIEKRFPEFAAKHSGIPLRNAYEMRNTLARGYFKTDLSIVWKTSQSDLQSMKVMIEEIINR